jgi:hypothetical protein
MTVWQLEQLFKALQNNALSFCRPSGSLGKLSTHFSEPDTVRVDRYPWKTSLTGARNYVRSISIVPTGLPASDIERERRTV